MLRVSNKRLTSANPEFPPGRHVPRRSTSTESVGNLLLKTLRDPLLHGRTFSPPEIFFPVGKLALTDLVRQWISGRQTGVFCCGLS
jgi:hypothetical protein